MGFANILIFVLAILGTPLFIVISALALISFHSIDIDLSVVIIEMSRLSDTPLLLSLPLFIFAGTLLAESGTPQRLLRLSQVLLGWMPGGLAVVSLLVCAVFTAFTGASGVTIFAIGGLLYPALIKDNYSERFSLGLITSSGSLGLLFPPSLPLILYGVISETRVDQLFLAGILPGILMLILLVAYSMIKGPGRRVKDEEKPTYKDMLAGLKEAAWELPLPFIVLGGIYGGFFVAGEAAAITALYVLIVEVLIYRDISITKLPKIIVQSMVLFGGILVVLAASMATTNYLVDQQVPMRLFELIREYISSKYTFLLLLNIFLLIVGSMLDIFSALVLVVPIIIPIAEAYGVDLIHLGIIFLTNLQIGYCTPPVGLNLFLASYRFDKPVVTLYRATLPFLALLMLTLIIITYFPIISLFLVNLWG
ncbi:MAG: TRAP transporter large permease subunit [Desulfobulbaceae bacterium]|jgi:C4-dicarboxylate transporter, DctM subunit|nr:TRAP transporter large permease subunit [Desulfobulbaceae bacterium]HKJ14384.1 TRAP transporter large permease subunit [Desulfobulbales bacterium]MDH3541807.1 TRAP transporter large permease subunit [Desulfobulbaceae bacterium]MDH3781191.1 TRAP transporter large permease subunit [Desulfobulbaceae bacterium]MDH3866528.1 TRAP transporter large permease subunit [Desulfobulbaceae bacterium]